MQCVEQCDGPNPVRYEQPVWQSLNMFIGDLGCTSWFYLSYPSIHLSIYLHLPCSCSLRRTNERERHNCSSGLLIPHSSPPPPRRFHSRALHSRIHPVEKVPHSAASSSESSQRSR